MLKIIAWVGTAASIIGSFVVAWQIFVIGYCFYLVGSVSWFIVAIARRDVSLAVLNGTFLLANLVGLWKSSSAFF